MFSKRVVEFTEDRDFTITVNGRRYTFAPDPAFGNRRVIVVTDTDDFRQFERKARRGPSPFRIAEELESGAMADIFMDAVKNNPLQFAEILAPFVKNLLASEEKPVKKPVKKTSKKS